MNTEDQIELVRDADVEVVRDIETVRDIKTVQQRGWERYFRKQPLMVYLKHHSTGQIKTADAVRMVPRQHAPKAIVCQVELPLILYDESINPEEWAIHSAIIMD